MRKDIVDGINAGGEIVCPWCGGPKDFAGTTPTGNFFVFDDTFWCANCQRRYTVRIEALSNPPRVRRTVQGDYRA